MLKELIKLFRQAIWLKWASGATRLKVRKILAIHTDIRIEIGAWNRRPGTNLITIDQDHRADLVWDLSQAVPLPDNSVSLIYTSYLLEHLTFWEIQSLLRDCLRALKPGGVISICVPYASLYVAACVHNASFPPSGRQYEPGVSNTNSAIDKLIYIPYMRGHHKYMFDKENPVNLLALCGFFATRLRGFDPQVDIAARDFESIYELAIKSDQVQPPSALGLNS